MDTLLSRKSGKSGSWPRKVKFGQSSVTIYRRRRKDGSFGYEVANRASGKRRLESFPTAESAIDRANQLARQTSERNVVAASMSNAQAADYASAVQALKPFNITLPDTAGTVAACLKLVGDLPSLHAAAKFYALRNKRTERKPVSETVRELLEIKTSRHASRRYLEDLRSRLGRFAAVFQKDACDITTAEIQSFLDGLKLTPQSYTNYRRVIHVLFEFAMARGYAAENPSAGVESLKVRGGDIAIFTPVEISKLLAAASPDFLPSLAIGAFAGLRSAEIERLDWKDIDLDRRCIVIGTSQSKTASRRAVPISDNLVAWLRPYRRAEGMVWAGSHEGFYDAQQNTAETAGVKWKGNGLRHSYASYRCAQIGDAGRVAGELGNSAAVVHRHYREVVKPDDADRWFSIRPDSSDDLIFLPAASSTLR